jgi:hypothetical protein
MKAELLKAASITAIGMLLGFAPAAFAVTISKTTQMAVQSNMSVDVDCSGRGGPAVTVGGGMAILKSGLGGRLRFQNNERGTHTTSTYDFEASVELLAADEAIQIPKQARIQGAGGNPYIWISFDGGASYSLIGRCAGKVPFSKLLVADFSLPLAADVVVSGTSCTNSGGSEIGIEGNMTLGGIDAKIVFTNNAKWTHVSASSDVVVGLTLAPTQESISVPKQPVRGGAGGNPIVYFAFDGDVAFTSLGRCNQL